MAVTQGYALIYVSAQRRGVRWPIRQGYAMIYVSAQIGGVRWPLHKDMPSFMYRHKDAG